jgi:ELWxxDGT repeat protein
MKHCWVAISILLIFTSSVFAFTAMVKDIRTIGPNQPSNPYFITSAGKVAFFSADDGVHGRELWKTDGTAAGTVMVLDIFQGQRSSIPRQFCVVGNFVFFVADDSNNKNALWKTNGTAGGTKLVKKGVAVTNVPYPDFGPVMADVNGTLFFSASDKSHGTELWKSDGTNAGTVMVTDIHPGPADSHLQYLTSFRGKLFFAANGSGESVDLWRSDGTPNGTVVLKAGSNPSGLTVFNNFLYFCGFSSSAGIELWKSDGNADGTVFVANLPANFPSIDKTQIAGGFLFLVVRPVGASGAQLWRTDGTSSGTIMVQSVPWPKDILEICSGNNVLYFVSGEEDELWKSNGTLSGTSRIKQFSSTVTELTFVNGVLYFSAPVSVDGGYQLWKSNGTDVGTVVVKNIRPNGPWFGSSPQFLTDFNNILIFNANDGKTGAELWRSDGTEKGTTLLKDIHSLGPGSSNPAMLTQCTGRLFFFATDDRSQRGLWLSDGTASSTSPIKNFGSNVYLENLMCAGRLLFFTADGELWRSDGTTAGTIPLKAKYVRDKPVNVNGTAFFVASDDAHGDELWKSDGTLKGTSMVRDILPGTDTSVPRNLRNINGRLYFSARDSASDVEPWTSDGSSAGTKLIKDINPGLDGSYPDYFRAYKDVVLFTATDHVHGAELWKTDGTEAGTIIVKDVVPGEKSSYPQSEMVSGDLLFFRAGSNAWWSEMPAQLFTSDGSDSGTVSILPIESKFLTDVDGTLFFSGNTNGQSGLWKSDGTSA